MKQRQPPARLVRVIRKSNRTAGPSLLNDQRISDAYREIQRQYRAIASGGEPPGRRWRNLAREALHYLGGDADRPHISLSDYDHRRYGPFLGISDDGGAAYDVCRAALASPKGQALGSKASALALGVALDAEWLGGVGEVPVGPDEFSDIWLHCTGRGLMTTNVGSRVNLRNYLAAPVVTIAEGDRNAALAAAKAGLAEAFHPFLKTPDGKPRPL